MHIIGSRGPGGAEGFYCRLVQGLARSGSSVHAINPPASEVGKRLDGAVPQAHVRMLGAWDLRARFRIGQIIRSLRPAIVQTYLGRATRLTQLSGGSGPVHIARLGGYYDLKSYRHARAWVGITRGLCDYLVRQGLPAGRYYHIADVVVSSSHHESLGNTILEAWAHRRPVVATATPGARELIDHGASGFLTPVGDARALARGLAELIQNPMFAERLAEAGYQEVRTRFSPEVIVAAYADLYGQLIEKSPRSA